VTVPPLELLELEEDELEEVDELLVVELLELEEDELLVVELLELEEDELLELEEDELLVVELLELEEDELLEPELEELLLDEELVSSVVVVPLVVVPGESVDAAQPTALPAPTRRSTSVVCGRGELRMPRA
jgi:hypothetical protein